MFLQYLIEDLKDIKSVNGNTQIELSKIEYDSKKIEENDLFVAIKGFRDDGKNYIKVAIENGAKAIIVEDEIDIEEYQNITFIFVENARIALALCAARYYDFPARKLKIIGITGTKGKTSTAYMIRDILNASSKQTGMIGTIYNTYADVKIEATRTSPESLDLQRLLKQMVDANQEYVVMEVSSATYGLDNEVNLTASDIRINAANVEFKMYVNKMLETIQIGIPGRFTVYNALAAIGVCSLLGCQMDAILMALSAVKVPGRAEIIPLAKTFTVMVDYAHNPSSLEAILSSVKKFAKGRIILVFGCGGNRDKEKRSVMGEIAGRMANFTVITTDNPRDESPKKIMSDIEKGIKQTRGLYKIIENRKQAIAFAMQIAWKNDIVIIAGKGHETYQELKNGKKIPFDERKVVASIAENMPDKNIE